MPTVKTDGLPWGEGNKSLPIFTYDKFTYGDCDTSGNQRVALPVPSAGVTYDLVYVTVSGPCVLRFGDSTVVADRAGNAGYGADLRQACTIEHPVEGATHVACKADSGTVSVSVQGVR